MKFKSAVCQMLFAATMISCADGKDTSEVEAANGGGKGPKVFKVCTGYWSESRKSKSADTLAPMGWDGSITVREPNFRPFSSRGPTTLQFEYNRTKGEEATDDQRKTMGLDSKGRVLLLKVPYDLGQWTAKKQDEQSAPPTVMFAGRGSGSDEAMFAIITRPKGFLGINSKFLDPDGSATETASIRLTCELAGGVTVESYYRTNGACKSLVVTPPAGSQFVPVYEDADMSKSLKIGLGAGAKIQNLGPISSGTNKERIKVRILSGSSIKGTVTDDTVYIWSRDLKCGDK